MNASHNWIPKQTTWHIMAKRKIAYFDPTNDTHLFNLVESQLRPKIRLLLLLIFNPIITERKNMVQVNQLENVAPHPKTNKLEISIIHNRQEKEKKNENLISNLLKLQVNSSLAINKNAVDKYPCTTLNSRLHLKPKSCSPNLIQKVPIHVIINIFKINLIGQFFVCL